MAFPRTLWADVCASLVVVHSSACLIIHIFSGICLYLSFAEFVFNVSLSISRFSFTTWVRLRTSLTFAEITTNIPYHPLASSPLTLQSPTNPYLFLSFPYPTFYYPSVHSYSYFPWYSGPAAHGGRGGRRYLPYPSVLSMTAHKFTIFMFGLCYASNYTHITAGGGGGVAAECAQTNPAREKGCRGNKPRNAYAVPRPSTPRNCRFHREVRKISFCRVHKTNVQNKLLESRHSYAGVTWTRVPGSSIEVSARCLDVEAVTRCTSKTFTPIYGIRYSSS